VQNLLDHLECITAIVEDRRRPTGERHYQDGALDLQAGYSREWLSSIEAQDVRRLASTPQTKPPEARTTAAATGDTVAAKFERHEAQAPVVSVQDGTPQQPVGKFIFRDGHWQQVYMANLEGQLLYSCPVKNNDGPAIMEHSADVANMAMMVLDVCGGSAFVEAAEPSPVRRDGLGLLTLEGDCIVMRFTADAAACAYANDPHFPEPRPPVIDKQQFLRDVFGALTKEREDGSTHLTDALDWATTEAVEQGSEGIGDMPTLGVPASSNDHVKLKGDGK
jgi:hypothetical protein